MPKNNQNFGIVKLDTDSALEVTTIGIFLLLCVINDSWYRLISTLRSFRNNDEKLNLCITPLILFEVKHKSTQDQEPPSMSLLMFPSGGNTSSKCLHAPSGN